MSVDITDLRRVGIYEVLGISIPFKNGSPPTPPATIFKIKRFEGMATMQMDGLIKSLCGITTVDEVLRATRE